MSAGSRAPRTMVQAGAGPLTVGTAGHIDHGKTALVKALTGVDTDRLDEEQARGISIALGYAPLSLPSGRVLSLVDVPGHERFVRTMVSGATGIDLYLMVVAADDGVMPQSREHAAVLAALGVRTGVVAVTKADLADPARALAEARGLLPDAAAIVPCSARSGTGVAELAAALDAAAAGLMTRADRPEDPLLHIDRCFSVRGVGTVVTGTLWSGTIAVGDRLTWLPAGRQLRVRALQIHDAPQPRAAAGQRVAVNLVGVSAREIARGDVLTVPGRVQETRLLDCRLDLVDGTHHNERVQVHHGTRDVPGRLAGLGGDLWQLRLEKPLLAADGDAVVVRRLSPPDTLGGGRVLDAAAVKHGRRPEALARLRARLARPETAVNLASAPGSDVAAAPNRADSGREPDSETPAAPTTSTVPSPPAAPTTGTVPFPPAADAVPSPLPPGSEELTERLTEVGLALLNAATLGPSDRTALRALVECGVAVRVSGELYAAATVADDATGVVVALITATGSVSLAEVRDRLGTGRKSAQAMLEHLDARRITRRRPDDRRVLRAGSSLFLNAHPSGADLRKAAADGTGTGTDGAATAANPPSSGRGARPVTPDSPEAGTDGTARDQVDLGPTAGTTHGR